jgi:hypothetical protein
LPGGRRGNRSGTTVADHAVVATGAPATSLEGFSSEDTGYLIGASPADVDPFVAEALEEIERQTLADVLIIEDEPIIAMDIETIVATSGTM